MSYGRTMLLYSYSANTYIFGPNSVFLTLCGKKNYRLDPLDLKICSLERNP
jgi:hypothetical protein